MITFGKVVGWFMLITGVPLSTLALVSLPFLLSQQQASERTGALLVLLLSGIWGLLGWQLLRTSAREQQQKEHARLQEAFFKLLKSNGGKLSPLDFAAATSIPANTAKSFLEQQHCDFGGSIEVDKYGNMYYQYPPINR